MKRKNKVYVMFGSLLALVIFSFGFGIGSTKLWAQDLPQEALDAVGSLVQDLSGMSMDMKCQIVERSLAQREKYFLAKKNNHQRVYSKITSRMDLLKFYLDSEGVDITGLVKEINIYKSNLDAFNLSYIVFSEKLAIAKAKSCGDSTDNFNLALEEARLALVDVRKSSESLKMHYMQNVRQEFCGLKLKLREIYE